MTGEITICTSGRVAVETVPGIPAIVSADAAGVADTCGVGACAAAGTGIAAGSSARLNTLATAATPRLDCILVGPFLLFPGTSVEGKRSLALHPMIDDRMGIVPSEDA